MNERAKEIARAVMERHGLDPDAVTGSYDITDDGEKIWLDNRYITRMIAEGVEDGMAETPEEV